MVSRIAFLLLLITALNTGYSRLQAQSLNGDTLRLTLKQAEDQFVQNNLQVIIQRYNIDIASAEVITARLFPNPDFSFNNGIYAHGNTTAGPAYKEQSASVSQLFQTAGKRNKNIRLAQIGVEQAQYQFFDLLRTLKYTLRNDFYNIYFQEQSSKVYSLEISSLSNILKAFKEQYAKGNIAEKEVLRIQSQLYSLQSEYINLQTGIDTTQSELRMLIKAPSTSYIVPLVNDSDLNANNIVTTVPYQRMLDSAYVNRYDLRYAKASIDYNNMNLELQKANAVPDINLSLGFDKLGAYGNNYLGGGIEFNLPFFNRNQGNIKQARIAIDQSKVQMQNTQNQIDNDVATNYRGALRVENLYHSFDPKFRTDFTHLIREVVKNYAQRNISLLEFLDFYDSYKNNVLQLNNIEYNRINSLEQLNYVTGTTFFNKQ